MKKILGLILCICLVFALCGCSARETISSDKQEYIVASLGFDKRDGKYAMFMESIVVNTEDMNADKQNIILEGIGESIEEAYSQIISKITQPLSLGHNAVTVIGRSVDAEMFKEILNYCSENKELNIGSMLIFTESAEKLLASKPISSVAVGYDLMSMLEVSEEETGQSIENRLYEVRSKTQKPFKIFSLPHIAVNGEEFSIDGLTVFEDYGEICLLSTEEAGLYFLVTDRVSRGELVIEGRKTTINFSKTTYDFSLEENLVIRVNMRLKLTGGNSFLKKKTEEFIKQQKTLGRDIFGFSNIIEKQNPKLWRKIKNNYTEYFKNSKIEVRVNE